MGLFFWRTGVIFGPDSIRFIKSSSGFQLSATTYERLQPLPLTTGDQP